MSTERQDRTLRRKPLPAALLVLALAALVPYSAHSKVAASFHGRLTNEVQNGVSIARTRDALGRDTGYTLCALPEGGRVALVATAPESSVTNSNGEKGTGPQFLSCLMGALAAAWNNGIAIADLVHIVRNSKNAVNHAANGMMIDGYLNNFCE